MRAVVLCLVCVLSLAIPGPAHAKVPWWSVEIEPTAPVAGEPLRVVIRFWGDPRHTRPSNWWPDQSPGGVVAFDGPGGRVPLTLTRTGDGTYAAETTLVDGTWTLLTDQQFSGATGPTHVDLATVTVATAPIAPGAMSTTVIGVALVASGLIWRRRRSAG